jgi:hypothetical protein
MKVSFPEYLRKHERLCVNCGQPIIIDSGSAMPIHMWGRWDGDTGWFCYNTPNSTHASTVCEF